MAQGELFPDSLLETEPVRKGYRGSAASRAAGITYRQLDYWAHKHIVEPSVTASHGSGSRRLYSFNDVLMLAACKKLLDLGVNLQNISQTLQFLRAYRSTQLSHMVIVCDGEHVRACEGETMFADVLQHESAVFIIAVGTLFRQVESSLAAAVRRLGVDSDGPLARLPIVAKGTRLHHRDAHVEPPYCDVPLDIDGHSYAVA